MELRKRPAKLRNASSGRGDSKNRRITKGEKLDKGFTSVIAFVFSGLVLGFSLATFYPETTEGVLDWAGIRLKEHAVVIDAGSTGSRVLGFSFARGLFDKQLHLEDELWKEVKPGLSSYADEPKEAAESIIQLLAAAKERIPEKFWPTTPIVLKATAGLRLLPAEKSDAIIQEVEKVLLTSGFKPISPVVEIMNPRDEGMYAWFTVNFLLNLFGSVPLDQTHASLDLGGGSTQITFAPKQLPVAGLEGRSHFMHEVSIFGQKREIYTHSYLGLGLMAAREAIFTQGVSKEGDSNQFSSPCLSSATPQKWSFHGKNYLLTRQGSSTSYEKCLETVRKVISSNDVHVPQDLSQTSVAVFSYFYDRAVDNQILQPGVTDGVAKIESFVSAAKKACNDANDTFHCIDLTFISSLLLDGYGLPIDTELKIFKKINGYEASWALGAAFNLLEGQ